MVGAGFAMLALAAVGVFMALKRSIPGRWFLQLLVPAIALPYLANSTGWLLTELGRQPWIVFGLMKTADAASPNVSAGMVAFSLVGFTLLYAALMIVDVYLLARYAKGEPGAAGDDEAALAAAY